MLFSNLLLALCGCCTQLTKPIHRLECVLIELALALRYLFGSMIAGQEWMWIRTVHVDGPQQTNDTAIWCCCSSTTAKTHTQHANTNTHTIQAYTQTPSAQGYNRVCPTDVVRGDDLRNVYYYSHTSKLECTLPGADRSVPS